MRSLHERLLVGLLVLAAAAAACGWLVGSTSGRTVTVGPDASGRVITLAVGDHLVVDLGRPFGFPAPDQVTLGYPHDVLALVSSDRTSVRFEFEAQRTGQGRVVVINAACQPVAGGTGGAP